MKVVTASEMREIDRTTIEELGIPSLVLMERAGLGVVKQVEGLYKPGQKEVLVIAGPGNNGGDGLVVARNLYNKNYRVQVYLMASPDKLSPDCKRQYEICRRMKVPVKTTNTLRSSQIKDKLVIDAILGTGLNKNLREDLLKAVRAINDAQTEVIAVDIPTGLSSDTGQPMPEAVRADITVTFGLPKRGHLIQPGREYTGKLVVEDIGFPGELLRSESIKVNLVEEEEIRALLPHRPPDAHKGTFGHVLVVGGSKGKTGAIRMTAKAVLRTGAGLVTIATPEEVLSQLPVLEEMTLPIEGYSRKALTEVLDFIHRRADVIAVGPGMGREPETMEFVLGLLKHCPVPSVVDADALFALSSLGPVKLERFLQRVPSPLVLTPHTKEMERLTEITTDEIKTRPIEVAREFSIKTGACLVLKGSPTIVSSEGKVFINPTGSEAMATAGSGDVLTGIISGLIAQGLPPLEASIAGVYLHGLSGDIGAARKTSYGLIAGDLIEHLPEAFRAVL